MRRGAESRDRGDHGAAAARFGPADIAGFNTDATGKVDVRSLT